MANSNSWSASTATQIINTVALPLAASATVSDGDYVGITNGYASRLTDTAGLIFAGQAQGDATETTGTNGGSASVIVQPVAQIAQLGYACFGATSPVATGTSTWVGKYVFATGAGTAALSTTATNVCLGQCVLVVQTVTSGIIAVDVSQRSGARTAS